MPKLCRATRHVAQWFVTPQPNEESLPRSEAIERETGANEGHGTGLGGDVQNFICGFRLGHDYTVLN